jgi:flagellar motor switch protein FliN
MVDGDAVMAGGAALGLDLLGMVPVRVSVEVGSASMRLADLLGLAEGGIVELDRPAGDPLDIVANGALVARGEVVAVDGRYAVRVTEIADADPTAARRERRRP